MSDESKTRLRPRSQRGAVEDRWRKKAKDEHGNAVEVPSANAGKVTRWRARYVDNAGREHTKHFDRKVDAQNWLKQSMASVVRGDHVAPKTARLTVGEWCDTWLDGYRTRRKSTVRQAEVIKEHFGAVPLVAVKPSDVRGWTSRLKEERRADSYVYALHARLSQLFSDAVHDGIVPRNPCSRRTSPGAGRPRPHVATTEQVWALRPLGDRASGPRLPREGRGDDCRLPVSRPAALLRLAAHRLGPRGRGCAGAAPPRLGQDHPRHLRPPLARPRRHQQGGGGRRVRRAAIGPSIG